MLKLVFYIFKNSSKHLLKFILLTIRSLPVATGYFLDYLKVLSHNSRGSTNKWDIWPLPYLHDRFAYSGELGEYFYQDQLVASKVYKDEPDHHLDVGSRIDGFILALTSTRHVNVLDIRALPQKVNNLRFIKGNICDPPSNLFNKFDYVTCLHTIEHIGLGRYGDPFDLDGWVQCLEGLSSLLMNNGTLFLSAPCSRKQSIYFNAHRLFNPVTIPAKAREYNLILKEFYILVNGEIQGPFGSTDQNLSSFDHSYGLLIYRFQKYVSFIPNEL